MWHSSRYQTRDHVIPFGLFWIYSTAMQAVSALERSNLARGTSSAIGLAFSKSGSELPPSIRAELRDAFLDDGS